jgi:hypothetical protein
MQSQSPQYTSPSFHNRTLFATPHTPQGPLGSPIQSSPDSPNYTPRDEIPPASFSSPPLSPPPPPGTTYHPQSPSYYTAHGTFTNQIYENSPVKRLHQPGLVRQQDKSYEQGIVTNRSVANDPIANLSPDHTISQNSPVLDQAQSASQQAGPSRSAPPNAPNSPSDRQRIEGGNPVTPAPVTLTEPPPKCTNLLIPILHYTGSVDVKMFPFIGQSMESDHYHEINSTFQVIGLTTKLIMVMRTCDMDHMLHLLQIDQSSLSHNPTPIHLHHEKLELLCYELKKHEVLRKGIDLDNDVIPRALQAQHYTWYIMPEGGAYVYDAWQTPPTFNPNIVLLVQYQPGYGVSEGGLGRPTVLDHPLHIALFENNIKRYRPPHQRFMNVNDQLRPPESCTPRYPHKLDTVLRHTHGNIEHFHRSGYRGGISYHMLRRWEVERTPSPPLTPYYYTEDDQRRSEAALRPLSPDIDSYGNTIGGSTDPEHQSL